MKKEKEIHASFAVAPHITKVMAIVHGKCLVKMKRNWPGAVAQACNPSTLGG